MPDTQTHATHTHATQARCTANDSIRDQLERLTRRQYPTLVMNRRRRLLPQAPLAHRSLRWQDRMLLILACLFMALLLVRIETAQAADPWGLELQFTGGAETSLALDTAVHVEVSGLLARVHVAQTFRNTGSEWTEGVYRYPLPAGAAVDRLWVQVGERVLEGEIQERETAQRTFQLARDAGQLAGLVEQERANQFSSRLANIGPGEEVHVLIGFLTQVGFADGVFRLRLPTTFNQRHGEEPQPGLATDAPRPWLVANPSTDVSGRRDHALDMEIELRTGLELAGIESLYHDVEVLPVPGGYQVLLTGARSDRDFELAWYPDLASVARSSLQTWQDGDAVYAQMLLVPPVENAILPAAREVVFIIDTSGSMQGISLAQARSALRRGLDELDADDRFNIIEFNSETRTLFEHSVPAAAVAIGNAKSFLDSLQADGGTEMAPALDAAFRLPAQPGLLRQVVFITDGSVGNESHLLEQIGAQLGSSRLFTVSIGTAPNSWFMRKAAEVGRGSHTHIGELTEVNERMRSLWTRIRLPAIQDLEIDWGMPAEYYPEILPDLYAGDALWVVARLPGQPLGVGLSGRFNDQEWHLDSIPLPEAGSEMLETLWARRKLEALQDSVMYGLDPQLMREGATRVALEYGLLSPFTSLVAVDRSPARPATEQLTSTGIPSLLPAGSQTGLGFPSTALGWRSQVLLSLFTLSLAAWFFWSPGTLRPARSKY